MYYVYTCTYETAVLLDVALAVCVAMVLSGRNTCLTMAFALLSLMGDTLVFEWLCELLLESSAISTQYTPQGNTDAQYRFHFTGLVCRPTYLPLARRLTLHHTTLHVVGI